MKWLFRRKLGTVLVLLSVVPLIFTTAAIAFTAITLTEMRWVEQKATAPEGFRDEFVEVVSADAAETSNSDAQLTSGLIVAAWLFAMVATRRLRRRMAELRRFAEKLSDGQLDVPVRSDGADELGTLAAALDRMREDLIVTERLATAKAELERDMALTAELQARFMPNVFEQSTKGVELAAHYSPASRCGGDWWWSEQVDDGSLLVLLGDVTGHGAGSALITASMSTAFDYALARGLGNDVPSLLGVMSACLHDTAGGDYGMTMSVLRVDGASGELQWWNAGAPPIVCLRASGELVTWAVAGSSLGGEDLTLRKQAYRLEAGDTVFVFTDGVPELKRANGRELGPKRLGKLFRDHVDGSAAQTRDALATAVRELVEQAPGQEQEDDISFLLLRRTG